MRKNGTPKQKILRIGTVIWTGRKSWTVKGSVPCGPGGATYLTTANVHIPASEITRIGA